MVHKNEITWNNDYKHDGVLYFMQRVIEMLDYNTIDIYRTPLLNTSRLIVEYLQISEGYTKEFHLNEVLNELKMSLENDIVLHYKFTKEQIDQILKKLNKTDNKKSVVEYLNCSIVPNYLNWCIEYIRFIVPQNKFKKNIERAIRCYIPELFRYGYNREDIFYDYREVFCSNTNPTEIFNKLISAHNSPTEFSVYLSVHNELLSFKDVIERNLSCSLNDDGNFNKLHSRRNYSIIKLPSIKAMSMTSAVEYSLDRLNTFLRFYRYFGNYSRNLIQSHALVVTKQGDARIIQTKRDKFNSIENENHSSIGELSTAIISGIFHSSWESMPELQKILKLHNNAISNNGLENGFLNLWSILEITCVYDPNKSKIDQVIEKLLPVLKLKYFTRVFEHISSNLQQVTPKQVWDDLLKEIIEGSSNAEKIAYLALCPKYSNILDVYSDNLHSYPVIRTRLLNLHDDFSKHRKEMLNYINRYAKRVSWHLYRIYRARNIIAHNGKEPHDLKDLGEHLHAYVDCLVSEILVKMCIGPIEKMSSVFIDSALYFESIEAYLNNDSPFDEKGVALLFSASLFCWCNNKTNLANAFSQDKPQSFA